MKKLLLILLPISIFLVSCGGGEGDLQPIDPPTLSLEETLVGKKWSLSNEDEDGFILSPGGGFFTTKKCTPHDWEGSWFFEGNLIKYSYTQNSIQTTVLWGEVTEYSATEVKILEESSSTLTTEKVYYITPEDIYGCMDSIADNYNPNANCESNCTFSGLSIGDTTEGGIVFWFDGNGGGLVAALSDEGSNIWGWYGNNIPGADGTTIGTGYQNTIDIGTGPAALVCSNLTIGEYSDWFLPSKDELYEMYLVLHLQGFGGFNNANYWSSSEVDGTKAWRVNFADGSLKEVIKNNGNGIRPIRSF